jgi:hypothetical protein
MARLVCATTVLAASVLVAPLASAFELKHTVDGDTVHWGVSAVSFVIDPSVEAAVPGGSAAVASAVSAWSGASGAPTLSSTVGPGGAKPAFDGQNSIVYMPQGYGPAGNALAVTVSTLDDADGELLDTDIVFNGRHPFAVLPAGAASEGAALVPTDGAGEDGAGTGSFDLQHVAAHEVGHALGLADVHDDPGALMFAMTAPGSADHRAPASDDEAGLEQLYAGVFTASPGGCGQGTVAGAHAHGGRVWFGFVTLAAVAAGLASRRRRGLAMPVVALSVALLGAPDASRAASDAVGGPVETTARVVAVSTGEASGVLQTLVDFVPATCDGRCPAPTRALVWGGTRGGITQKIDGANVPRVGDTLDVTSVPGHAPVVVVRARAS